MTEEHKAGQSYVPRYCGPANAHNEFMFIGKVPKLMNIIEYLIFFGLPTYISYVC
jgi:hypothetical protein